MATLEELKTSRAQLNRFMTHNFIELSDVQPDRAQCRLVLRPESTNPFGIFHGGALYTMADNAAGNAAHTDGRLYVTQNSFVNYRANLKEGAALATATVVHRGRKTCLVEVEIAAEETGKILLSGTFTFFCVGTDTPADLNA